MSPESSQRNLPEPSSAQDTVLPRGLPGIGEREVVLMPGRARLTARSGTVPALVQPVAKHMLCAGRRTRRDRSR